MKSFSAYWSENFNQLRIRSLDKRAVTFDDLAAVINHTGLNFLKKEIGKSYEGRPIDLLTLGTGSKNILAWSCMHGNETTSLRGWMDVFAAIHNGKLDIFFADFLNDFTIYFIPMLNPDGAQRYTRRNAMNLDMNRDVRALQTPEMKVLTDQIILLKPVLAFNLHDQRNIFAVNSLPATISFLAPSIDLERTVSDLRATSMKLIASAVIVLKQHLKGGIGRYSDEYYPTAIGEFVQQKGIPTILVECGPAKNDPLRQEARMANALILHAVLSSFSSSEEADIELYKNLPLNETNQVDIIIRNVIVTDSTSSFKADLALLAEESIDEFGQFIRKFKIHDFGDLQTLVGLEEFNWKSTKILMSTVVGALADVVMETDGGEVRILEGKLKD